MSKTGAARPLTTMVPVTTMEEMPAPSDAERSEMLASLQRSEREIAAGDGQAHDPQTFVAEMLALRASAKRSQKA